MGWLGDFLELVGGQWLAEWRESRARRRRQKEIAASITDACEATWARKIVLRWLESSQTYGRMSVANEPRTYEELHASLRDELAAAPRGARLSADEIDQLTRRLVGAAIDEYPQTLDVPDGIAMVDMRGRAERGEILEEVRSQRVPTLVREASSRLPPRVSPLLEQVAETDPRVAGELLKHLTIQDRVRRTHDVQQLLLHGPRPGWLEDAPAEAWMAIGEYANAYQLPAEASLAFEAAADAGMATPARVRIRAALLAAQAGDTQRAERLAVHANEGSGEDRYVRLLTAALHEDVEAILSEGRPDSLDRVEQLHVAHIESALAIRESDDDKAIEILRDVELDPARESGLAVVLGQHLFRRGHRGGSPNAEADLEEAHRLALAARGARRRWGGPIADAVALACATAARLGQWHLVVEYAAPPPDGEAEHEAEDPNVASQLMAAAVVLDDEGLLDEAAERVADHPFFGRLAAGYLADRDGNPDVARRHLRSAWESASGDVQRNQVLWALAEVGAWPLPGIDDVRDSDPAFADLLVALSEIGRDQHDDAVAKLRRWQNESRHHAELLAQVHMRLGSPARAADVLEAAGRRFHAPRLIAQAAAIYGNGDDFDAAIRLGQEALVGVDAGSRLGLQLRRQLTQWEMARGNWREAENHIRVVIDTEARVDDRWLLAGLLHNQHRFEEAWAQIERLPKPTGVDAATLWVVVARRFLATSEWGPVAFELADRYPDSEELRAAVLMGVWTAQDEVREDIGERARDGGEQFIQDFPDSDRIFTQPFPEDPEELVESLRNFLEPQARLLEEQVQKVRRGHVPLGLLAATASRTYTEALARRAAGLMPICDIDRLEEERGSARGAVATAIAVDLSAIHVISLVDGMWEHVISSFDHVVVGDRALNDVGRARTDVEQPGEGTLGWDTRSDRPSYRESDPEAEEVVQSLVAEMWRISNDADIATVGQLAAFPDDLPTDRFGSFLDAIELASRRQIALYADDVALRTMARDLGIPAFGTVALMDVLEDEGRLDGDLRDRALRELRRNYAADLPFEPDKLWELAHEEEWRAAAAAFQVSRARSWQDPAAAKELFDHIREQVAASAPEEYPGWVYAGILGFGSRVDANSAVNVAGLFVASASVDLNADVDLVGRCLAMARQACTELGIDDPLPAAARFLYEMTSQIVVTELAMINVLQAFSGLNDEDQRVVIRSLPAHRPANGESDETD